MGIMLVSIVDMMIYFGVLMLLNLFMMVFGCAVVGCELY